MKRVGPSFAVCVYAMCLAALPLATADLTGVATFFKNDELTAACRADNNLTICNVIVNFDDPADIVVAVEAIDLQVFDGDGKRVRSPGSPLAEPPPSIVTKALRRIGSAALVAGSLAVRIGADRIANGKCPVTDTRSRSKLVSLFKWRCWKGARDESVEYRAHSATAPRYTLDGHTGGMGPESARGG